jgi:vancomycin aglycone glucosyltransferase
VLLLTYGSRGDVEPVVALAVRLREVGAEARVAAVVHHGGAGTTTTGTRAGAPQVVVPQATDQPYWADRVAELGIGAAHDGPTPTTESLSAALRTALAPETRARATAVAGTVRTDGTTVAATLLLDAAARERTPASAQL